MKKIIALTTLLLFSGCSKKVLTLSVENPLNIKRENETVEVKFSDIEAVCGDISLQNVQVKEKDIILPSQAIDCNQDEKMDLLIFQADFGPGEKKEFIVIKNKPMAFETQTYARFVPEREDDFAWENDRIAFRMYSKKLAAKENVDSGIDVWVKRVDDLVIDKWYKSGHYHEDNGEGLDFYKVGPSRGCGGLALYIDGEMVGNGGFASHKVIANGPVRSVFELTYEPVTINEKTYTEVRRISLDAGSNMNKIVSNIKTTGNFEVAAGLKIHEDQGPGALILDRESGYLSFWEPATTENGELGAAIVMKAGRMKKIKKIDEHHAVIAEVEAGEKMVYYTGAGWSKSGDFENQQQWHDYVKNYTQRINHPLIIKINQ